MPPVTYFTAYNPIFSMYKVLEAFQTKCAGSSGTAGQLLVWMRKSLEEGLGWGRVESREKAGHVVPPGLGSGAESTTCCLVEQAMLR